MTRFLNEQRRIEQMEANFNNLIKSSVSVKEKLDQVSSSDDILQAVQVQIRKLEDSIKETDEKFQRVERKNEVLDQTNEGIDRNFKSLQKTETAIKNAEKIISALADQFDNLRASIELLASQNEKATNAVDKIATLDDSLAHIEKRIAEMDVAREWVARTETDLKALDKDAKSLLHLTKSLLDRESGKAEASGKGSATPQDRENILRLKSKGWSVDEIANAMGRARGEIELILEIASRGA
jgi:DNA repair exonuclease SbcCD ATPase subunit